MKERKKGLKKEKENERIFADFRLKKKT